jgi:HEPN domain-containing protein
MTKEELIEYWVSSSNQDFKVMENLLKNRHYPWALFIGHLVIEKLIKACFVKKVSAQTPYSHNLLVLAEQALLQPSEKQKDELQLLTTFNIRARYPDYKMEFHKKCTAAYAKRSVKIIMEHRTWLLKQALNP